MEVAVGTVNFIRARGLNHYQFDSLLSDKDITCGMLFHTKARQLS